MPEEAIPYATPTRRSSFLPAIAIVVACLFVAGAAVLVLRLAIAARAEAKARAEAAYQQATQQFIDALGKLDTELGAGSTRFEMDHTSAVIACDKWDATLSREQKSRQSARSLMACLRAYDKVKVVGGVAINPDDPNVVKIRHEARGDLDRGRAGMKSGG